MILFVGDRPSKRMKPGARPFEGAGCEQRLLTWMRRLGLVEGQYTLLNQSDVYELTGWLVIAILRKYPAIALGNVASEQLRKQLQPHFKLPHPSGRNRQINDKAFIEQRLTECLKYIQSFR